MTVLWIMVPAPFVGYLVLDSVRKIFSEDDKILWRAFQAQPVSMIAGTTALGSVIVGAVVRVVLAFL